MLLSRPVLSSLPSSGARPALLLAALLAVALTLPATVADAGPKRVTTGPVTSAAFQAIVDAAEPGTTIECQPGIYDFSGGPVNITKRVHIVAADPANPPVFQGSGLNGTDPATGNTGFYFPPRSDELNAGRIDGVSFIDFERTILVNGSIDFDAFGCPATGGSVKGLEIVDSRITDARRGVQIITRGKNITLRDNEIDVSGQAILVVNDVIGCATGGPVHPGRVSGLHVSGNTLTGGGIGTVIVGTENALIRDNTIAGSVIGLFFGDDTADIFPDDGPIRVGDVQQNSISALYPIDLAGRTTMRSSSVQNNVLAAGDVAVFVEEGGNGFKISSNTFLPSGLTADVFLGGAGDAGFSAPPDSHDNTVVAGGSVTRVLDFGVDNKLVGKKIELLNPRLKQGAFERLRRMKRRVLREMRVH